MFIEQGLKGNNEWWRVLITVALTTGIFVLNFIVFLFIDEKQLQTTYDMMKSMPKLLGLAVNLIPFVFLLGLLFLLVRLLHERSILSLTTSRKKVDFKRILFSFSLIVFITLISFAASYYNDNSDIIWNFNPMKFTLLLIVSLLLFPFQIGFEEYLFRGYLMQQLGVISRNKWFPLLITSVFFGLFHSANPEVAEFGFGVMIFYIGTGFLLGIMTLMDEGLELSLGFHLGNNLMAILLISSDFSALQSDAVFRYSGEQNPKQVLLEMIILILISYPILLFILSKKYNWTNWKEKLTGKIEPENNFNAPQDEYSKL